MFAITSYEKDHKEIQKKSRRKLDVGPFHFHILDNVKFAARADSLQRNNVSSC